MLSECHAEFEGGRLTLGNRLLRREWTCAGGMLTPVSVKDRVREVEWVELKVEGGAEPAPVPSDVEAAEEAAQAAAGNTEGAWEVAGFEVVEDDLDGAAEKHLRADLVLRFEVVSAGRGAGDGASGQQVHEVRARTESGPAGGVRVVRRFRVWPDWPVVLQSVVVEPDGGGGEGGSEAAAGRGGERGVTGRDRWAAMTWERWVLPGGVTSWETVELRGRSDWRDDLVEVRRGVVFEKQTREHRGHLLHLTRWDRGAGLAGLKLAPPPDEQLPERGGLHVQADATADGDPAPGRGDFKLAGLRLTLRGGGLSAAEVRRCAAAGVALESYPVAVGATDGSAADAAALLRGTIRRLARPRVPAGGLAMSNNWGGGGSVGVLSEAFVLAELDAAAAMGLSQVQVDAGWHRGDARALGVEQLEPASTSATDADFWAPHPERFPRGLGPLRDRARELGLDLGLWFCLDRADDYGRWRDDLATLLGLWRDSGVTHFKFDGVGFTSRLGEMRVRRLLAELHQQSGGEVAASIDITASKSRRFGLTSGFTHVRDHFVENRYTGNATYRPHRTLRNLWQLARYVPSYRLEMEWLNVHRHLENYPDPLAPAAFGVEYSLATTLMALPLAWMHLQALPREDADAVGEVLRRVRPHQQAMLHGHVLPLGDEPDGTAWTGFLSTSLQPPHPPTPPASTSPAPATESPPADHGYLMLYREVNDADQASLHLPSLPPGATLTLEPLAGQGSDQRVTLDMNSRGRFHLAAPRSYALYRWTRIPTASDSINTRHTDAAADEDS